METIASLWFIWAITFVICSILFFWIVEKNNRVSVPNNIGLVLSFLIGAISVVFILISVSLNLQVVADFWWIWIVVIASSLTLSLVFGVRGSTISLFAFSNFFFVSTYLVTVILLISLVVGIFNWMFAV